MNSYGKKLMGIALIAALSSGITIGAFSILNKSADSKIQDQSLDSGYAQPTRFTRVINRPAVETDFTTAAENTVNAVVSIKSISTSVFRIFLWTRRAQYTTSASCWIGVGSNYYPRWIYCNQ